MTIKKSIVYLILVSSLFCCGHPSKKSAINVKSFEPIEYAQRFGIIHFENSSRIFYLNNKDTQWSLSFDEHIKNPPRIAILSTVFAGSLELLNQQEQIVAIDNYKFYSDTTILNLIAKGTIISVGEEGQVQLEKLLAQRPDIVISSSSEFSKNAIGQRLENRGIKVLYCDNFKETHPLARAEWIKFFGVITGQSRMADSIFEMVKYNYNALTMRAKKRNTDSVNGIKIPQPKILTEAMFGDSWFVPGGGSYTAQLIADAGGEYIFKEKVPLHTYPMSLEDVLVRAKDADIWININRYKTFDELRRIDKRYTLFKSFSEHQLFNNNKRENPQGGNDFWEKGVGRPDIILSDLFKIFHSPNIADDSLYYYIRLK